MTQARQWDYEEKTTSDGIMSSVYDEYGDRLTMPYIKQGDARLIGAALELLDVCEAIVTAFGQIILPTHIERHLLEGAKAALRKAKGEAA